ncbi:MAG: hypothetical protein HY318_11750 [Armatimonadetes bacterium]|nr:hypothetical protein [Armatimonadota bacterium]
MSNAIFGNLRMIANNWRCNYRYHGGVSALARCLIGTWRMRSNVPSQSGPAIPKVDCITFSVVPQMTALWATFIDQAIDSRPLRTMIGDCSGALHRHLHPGTAAKVIPLLNYHHGEKLDLFLYKLCQAEYVVVTDDDIFWISPAPWQWAIAQMESDSDIAVVSLLPKKQHSSVLKGKVPQPMGSCFVVRRQMWLAETLSFKIAVSAPSEGYDWFYDTGEFAQVELLRRGYKIPIAPQAVQEQLLDFEGISSWTLKIQKYSGAIRDNVLPDITVRGRKALTTICLARGLADMIATYYSEAHSPHLVDPTILQRAECVCKDLLPESEVWEIQNSAEMQLARLRASIVSHRETAESMNRPM